MKYRGNYSSPIGEILLAADDVGLTGLWFRGQKHFAAGLDPDSREQETAAIMQAKHWLDVYFSGNVPDDSVSIHFTGTDFQNEVWELLRTIPYGKTVTYGELAKTVAKKRGLEHLSARAVGAAVGHNPVSLIVPCHRVMGAGGKLTGYAGGESRKAVLLMLEGVPVGTFKLE